MKKLMIAACAVAMACVAQAGTFVAYQVNYRNNDNNSSHYSHYLLTADQVYGSTSTSVDLNALAAKVESLFSSSGYADTKSALSANSFGVNWYWFEPDDAFWAGGGSASTDWLVADLYANGGFAVCLYENGSDQAYVVADRNHISYQEYLQDEPVDRVGFYLNGSWEVQAGEVAAPWNTVASVPEPTSGLLMLLGMAGLALKRKRA